MKQNLLIIGPIGNIGGRELETGFIAKTLGDSFNVDLCSTIHLTPQSQVYDFITEDQVHPINQLVYDKSIWFRFLAFLSYIKSSRTTSVMGNIGNSFAKKTGFKNYALNVIKDAINQNDIILICAQISSACIEEVVDYTSSKGKPIIFRTSSEIKKTDIEQSVWLEKVNLFIHHSVSNAKRLSALNSYNFEIIDQCTFKESKMLQIEPTSKFTRLLYIGRLSSEKGVLELIQFFKKLKTHLVLDIIGDGILLEKLKKETRELKNINILGFLSQDQIIQELSNNDALIISSFEESGPLVGLEAMASARLVISTKVGAMPNRLEGTKNQFWFDIKDIKSFEDIIGYLSRLSRAEIQDIANSNRERYLENYTMANIKNQYKNAIFKLLKTRHI